MWFFPAGAGVLSALFSVLVAGQWLRRRRPQQAAWAIALFMFAIASLAAAGGIVTGWTPAWFRVYYLFGAIINVPFLGAGTIYLLGPRTAGHIFMVLCVVGAVFAAGVVVTASLNQSALGVAGIPSGAEVWGGSTLPRDLSRYYSYAGFIVVVLGALWSAWRLARTRQEHLRPLVAGNILIAGGTTLVAAAGGLARFGQGVPFAVLLLAGVSVMFAGFLRTSAPSKSG